MLPPSMAPLGRTRSEAEPGSARKRNTALLASSSPACRKSRIGRLAALCPQAEPSALGQAECRRIASDFENGRGQRTARCCSFRKPQRLLQLSRCGLEEVLYLETILRKPHRIGQSRLAIGEPVADPQKGRGFSLPLDKGRQRQNKTLPAPALRMADVRISVIPSRGKPPSSAASMSGRPISRRWGNLIWWIFCSPRACSSPTSVGSLAFQFGNRLTQGKKSLLRRGMLGHGVSSIPICSLYVLMDSRALLKSQLAFWEKSRLLRETHESSRKFPRIDYMSSNKEHPWPV
jgi:hypothetical protein